jgi:hypothetical protein
MLGLPRRCHRCNACQAAHRAPAGGREQDRSAGRFRHRTSTLQLLSGVRRAKIRAPADRRPLVGNDMAVAAVNAPLGPLAGSLFGDAEGDVLG